MFHPDWISILVGLLSERCYRAAPSIAPGLIQGNAQVLMENKEAK
jgi:hypothetical protein